MPSSLVVQRQGGFTLEVTRIASDGCPNACSILYEAARKVTFELGYLKLITYTPQTESDSSLRGVVWKKVEVKPQGMDGTVVYG